VGLRRSSPAAPGRVHNSDATPRDRLFRRDEAKSARTQLAAVRHASSSLGARVGSRALLRVVLRNLAAIGAEPTRTEKHLAVASSGGSSQRSLPASSAAAKS